jgi:hypothetical protein
MSKLDELPESESLSEMERVRVTPTFRSEYHAMSQVMGYGTVAEYVRAAIRTQLAVDRATLAARSHGRMMCFDRGITIPVPDDWPVPTVTPDSPGAATCGTCGRSWDDTRATAWTPAPGGRCPFEPFH